MKFQIDCNIWMNVVGLFSIVYWSRSQKHSNDVIRAKLFILRDGRIYTICYSISELCMLCQMAVYNVYGVISYMYIILYLNMIHIELLSQNILACLFTIILYSIVDVHTYFNRNAHWRLRNDFNSMLYFFLRYRNSKLINIDMEI